MTNPVNNSNNVNLQNSQLQAIASEQDTQAMLALGYLANLVQEWKNASTTGNKASIAYLINSIVTTLTAQENATTNTTVKTLITNALTQLNYQNASSGGVIVGSMNDTQFLSWYRNPDSTASPIIQILNWLNGNYSFDPSRTNPVTYALLPMFLSSFWGTANPDIDGSVQQFMSQGANGEFSAGEWSGMYLAYFLHNSASNSGYFPPNPDGTSAANAAAIVASLTQYDNNSDPNYTKFVTILKNNYTTVPSEGTGGLDGLNGLIGYMNYFCPTPDTTDGGSSSASSTAGTNTGNTVDTINSSYAAAMAAHNSSGGNSSGGSSNSSGKPLPTPPPEPTTNLVVPQVVDTVVAPAPKVAAMVATPKPMATVAATPVVKQTVVAPNSPLSSSNDSSVPATPDEIVTKFNQLVQSVEADAGNSSKESVDIQNLLAFANNLQKAGQLTQEMKQKLIEKILEATSAAAENAYNQGYNGVKGEQGEKQFLSDASSYLKPFVSDDPSGMIQQIVDALSGQHIMAPVYAADHPETIATTPTSAAVPAPSAQPTRNLVSPMALFAAAPASTKPTITPSTSAQPTALVQSQAISGTTAPTTGATPRSNYRRMVSNIAAKNEVDDSSSFDDITPEVSSGTVGGTENGGTNTGSSGSGSSGSGTTTSGPGSSGSSTNTGSTGEPTTTDGKTVGQVLMQIKTEAGAPPAATAPDSYQNPNFPLPPSGSDPAPDPSLDASGIQGSAFYMKTMEDQILEKTHEFIKYLTAHPSDPWGLSNYMQFITNVSKFYSDNGQSVPSDITGLFDDTDAQTGALSAVIQAVETAYFFGYTNPQTGKQETGETAFKDYISQQTAYLQSIDPNGQNPYIQKMIQALNGQAVMAGQFDSDHKATADDHAANPSIQVGDRVWRYTLPGGKTIVYDFDSPNSHLTKAQQDANDPHNDVYYIGQIINNTGPGGAPDPWAVKNGQNQNKLFADYRILALNQLLKEFKDPIWAITIWLVTAFDSEFQAQESGQNETTDILTNLTNSYADPMLQLWQNVGYEPDPSNPGQYLPKLSLQDTQDFTNLFAETDTLMSTLPQMSSISGQFQENVWSQIYNLQVDTPGATPDPKTGKIPQMNLGDVLLSSNYTVDQKQAALLSLNPPPPATQPAAGDPLPQPSAAYTTAQNSLQQLSALFTGQSKDIAEESTKDTDVQGAADKTGDSIVSSSDSNSLVSMMMQIINNFKTQ